jgi:mono/diheme cytochrome c family protein
MNTGTTLLIAVTAPLCFSSLLLAQHSVETETNPMAGNPTAVAAGKRLYDGACQSCHGADAGGDRGVRQAEDGFSLQGGLH